MAAPHTTHWTAVKQILRYLKGTIANGLQFKKNVSTALTTYTDADWAGDADDRRSHGGYCIFFGDNIVSWSSKKQTFVSRSSIESEYRSMASAVSELLWILNFLKELHINVTSSPIVWCDNLSATALTINPIYHSRMKHIELDVHFIREKIANNLIEVNYIASVDQIADIFTKPLGHTQFRHLCSKLTISSLVTLRGADSERLDNG